VEVAQMNQGWAMARQVEAHRQDLAALANGTRVQARAESLDMDLSWEGAAQRSVTGLPVAGGRTVRRPKPLSERVGAWLIHAGTRLGGAGMTAS
jgi:hypothetical protein